MTKYNDGDEVLITHVGEVINSARDRHDNSITIRTEDNRKASFDLDRVNSITLKSHKRFQPGDLVMHLTSQEKYVVVKNNRVAGLSTGDIYSPNPDTLTSQYYTKVEL